MNKHDNYRQQPLGTSNADMGQWQTDTPPAQTVTKLQTENGEATEMLHSSSSSKIAETAIGSAEQLQIDGRSGLGDESERSDITPEKIVNDEHIRELAVRQMENIVSKVREGEAAAEGQYRYEDVIGEEAGMADALESLCSDEQGKQRLTDIVNESGMSVQELGDSLETLEMDKVKDPDFQWDNERVSDMAKYNSALRKLGWEPFKDDESLEKLFGTQSSEQSNDIQHRANQLGLITPEVTDRLYTHQYQELLDRAKEGGVDNRTVGYTVNSDLTPSGNNLIANYWHEQSKLIGGDAMQLCMGLISDAVVRKKISDTSEFVDEDGIMRDAFFRNNEGSLLYSTDNYYCYFYNKQEEALKLLEAHKSQASEADGSKTMIDMLGKMKDESGEYDIEAIEWFQGCVGGSCINSPGELFDGDQPTDEFYSLVFKRSYRNKKGIDKFMSHIDSEWQDHYGDTGRKYLSLVSTYPDGQSSFSSYERAKWLEDYLDAGGPTNELFDEIFLDEENIKIFRENPELQTELTGDKKSFIKFCDKYGLSNQDMRKCGLAVDSLSDYFDANGPTSKIKDWIMFNDVEVLYKYPELQEGLSAEQKSLIKFCEKYGFGSSGMYVYDITIDNLPDYFDASGPTSKMKGKILLNNVGALYECPELQEGLSAEQKNMVRFCGECDLDNQDIAGYGLTADNLAEYFDANGPTSKMINKAFFNIIDFLYKHSELQEGLSAERKSMVKFCEECGLDNRDIAEYGLTADNLSEYFDANGPTSKMGDKVLFSNIELLYKHPEFQEGLSDEQKSMVKFCEECGLNSWTVAKYRLTSDNLPEHFDANGPMPEFLQKIFLDGDYDVIYKYYQSQGEAGMKRMGFDDKQMTAIDSCGNIGEDSEWNNPRKAFGDYVNNHYDELTAEQIRWTANIIARLANSNASELADRSEAFTHELLKLDADKIPETLDRIEDIYIHNHLPYVGKNYLVFRTMHPSPNLEDDFNFSPTLGFGYGIPNTISPVLQQATGDIRSGKLDQMLNSRDTIIISDLLRASLGSNNRSIREYLATLKNGQTLLDQLSSGELAWDTFNQPANLMDKDTKANYDTLSTFAWHLATIYNSTLPGKEHPYQLIHQQVNQQSDTEEPSAQSNALQSDFTNLTSLIKPNSRYTLADRAVRYFAHFVGIEDLAGAERYMDDVVKEADARNRKTAEYLATTGEPKLQPGDLVKGMGGTDGYGIRYLSYAFQNGSISKEYLGDASRSDTTPLDADASIVLHGEQTINQTMDSMIAGGYGGGLWTVLRPDKDRFIITRRDKSEADRSVYDLSVPDANFDRTNLTQEEIDRRLREIAEAKRHRREALPKLEIFATGVDGDGHYGIRTGFGMDKVSYYISDRTTRTGKNLSGFNRGNGDEYTLVSEVTKLEIALGGFYIPIVDRDSEELIYTPDDYDKMREQMSGLSYYHTGDYQFAPEAELELPSTKVGEATVPSTSTIIEEIPKDISDTDRKHEVINQTVKQAITNIPELNLSYKDYLDGDLTENIVEMIDTGSTGRQTNAPGSGDFDYLARLDRSILNDPTKKQQITDALLAAFGKADEVNGTSNQIDNLDHNEDGEGEGEAGQVDNKSRIVNGNLRLKQVSIDGLAEPVDIDITFAQKTNKVQYPTDAALADRLSNIKNQSETKYQQVLANIIYAKQFLKAAGAYKPRRSPEAEGVGGLGGVGIENWVLQHGGSFKQAARDFLAVADNCSSFEDFCAHYPVWDYGENHKGIRSKPHDNFVADNMNQEGYDKMKQALRAVVG